MVARILLRPGRDPRHNDFSLIIYPYFAATIPSLIGIGAAIAVALWVAIRLGW